MDSGILKKIGIGGVFLVAGIALFWFLFFRSSPEPTPTENPGGFQTIPTQTVGVTPGTNDTVDQTPNTQTSLTQKIFRVVDGPIVNATVVQTLRPTTTLARYVQQNNGHVLEVALDSSGAVPRPISNTTIPGVSRALWAEGGQAVILQYLDTGVVKTVYLGFSGASSTTTRPVIIKFLPDGIQDIAVSSNGTSVAYLLRTAQGTDGYTAKADGTGSKKVFSLPLKEVLISWPSTNTILAYSKSASSAPGIAFSINVTSGAVTSLLYTYGLTLTADPAFEYLVYQTTLTGASDPITYARQNSSGKVAELSFDPYPEKCIWNMSTSTTMYCAGPLQYVDRNYLDLLHQGAAAVSEAITAHNISQGTSEIIAAPGGDEGGVDSVIDTMSLSTDGKYLLFVRRGDYSLWGVRLF